MFYEAELTFLRKTLRKCHINSVVADLTVPLNQYKNLIMYNPLTDLVDTEKTLGDILPKPEPGVIYRVTAPLQCYYLFLFLPEDELNAVFAIGPYLTALPTKQEIMEYAERSGLQATDYKSLEDYYASVPILPQTSHLFTMLETFGERLWGIEKFIFEDITPPPQGIQGLLPKKSSSSDEKDVLWSMRSMELRYSYENELMDAVTKGQSYKADMLLSSFSNISFEQRLSDPVRNIKNYCVIMNTLLRKAAEKGGVHPVYLDSASSVFAAKIEQFSSLNDVQPLMYEMFRSYCRLVRKHSMKDYSPPIQKAITYIDTDLTSNLSLSTISQALNISSSYLSTLFKKETGQTLTDYICQRRVNHAKHLLETTRLQVQTVAQHCGIMDVQYFSKIFKRITGKTPKEYRDSLPK